MAKELPYFKFTPDEWLIGDITIEDFSIQGLFINICAYYWKRDCSITIAHLWQRYSTANQEHIKTLFNKGILKKDSCDNVKIMFLDEQLKEVKKEKSAKIEAGKAGAAARWQSHGTPMILPMAKHGNIDIDIDIDIDINYIYTLYPNRDKNNNNRSTAKCKKDKFKIRKILKTKSRQDLEKTITDYLKDCETNKVYLKNFGTFLNQLPETPETPESQNEKKQSGWKVKI